MFSVRSLKVIKSQGRGWGARGSTGARAWRGGSHPQNPHRPAGAWPSPTFPQPWRRRVSLDGAGPSPTTAGEQEAGLHLDGHLPVPPSRPPPAFRSLPPLIGLVKSLSSSICPGGPAGEAWRPRLLLRASAGARSQVPPRTGHTLRAGRGPAFPPPVSPRPRPAAPTGWLQPASCLWCPHSCSF